MMGTDHQGAGAQWRSCPLMVSVPEAKLTAGECRGGRSLSPSTKDILNCKRAQGRLKNPSAPKCTNFMHRALYSFKNLNKNIKTGKIMTSKYKLIMFLHLKLHLTCSFFLGKGGKYGVYNFYYEVRKP